MVQEASIQTVQISRVVKATPEAAFRLFASEMGLREWLSDSAYAQPRQGGRLLLTWASGFAVVGTYETRQPGMPVVLTWQVPGETTISRIRAEFQAAGEETRVTLTHEGAAPGPAGREPKVGWEAALEVLQAVLETGEDIRLTRRPVVGIELSPLDAPGAARRGLPSEGGILIDGTVSGTGAEAAGLEQGDVLLELGGVETSDFSELVRSLEGRRAGDTVEIVYWRGGQQHRAPMTFSARQIPAIPPDAPALADALRRIFDELNGELDAILAGLSEAEADHRPAAEEWNVKEVLAHLTFEVRDTAAFLTSLLSDDEINASWHNVQARVDGFIAVYPTLEEALAALKRTQSELVAYVRSLPADFVAQTPTYTRVGLSLLTGAGHPRLHFRQIREAVAAARASRTVE